LATFKRYLGGIAISEITGASATRRYVFVDHLGLTDVITNASGTPVATQNFGPFGNRRGNDWQSADNPAHPITRTGFTGHEMADGVDLIQMNGRMYDPETGRFIQADPNIDEGLQGLNRYSYVLNNPLSSTDPTGYFSVKDFVRTALAVAITVYTGGSAGGVAWGFFGTSVSLGQAIAITAIGGFASGAVQTGTLKGGLEGAFSAMLFFGISGSYGGSDMMSRAIASGVGGGIISELQGGKFGHGFASAGVGSLAGNFAGKVDQNVGISIKRTVVAALAGGTASAVTGGKFGNGALTGAMSQAFGDWAQQASAAEASTNQFGDSISYEEASEFRIGPERRAPSEPAHADLGELQFVRSVANLFESFGNMEHCAYVCQGRTAGTSIKGFALSNVVSVGSRFSCSLSGSTCPLFTRAVSWIHNHPWVGAYTVNAFEPHCAMMCKPQRRLLSRVTLNSALQT